jgi:hypothetical protein
MKAIIDRLIELGYPSTLRPKAFAMWVAYLKRRKVIFVKNPEKEQYQVSQCADSL